MTTVLLWAQTMGFSSRCLVRSLVLLDVPFLLYALLMVMAEQIEMDWC